MDPNDVSTIRTRRPQSGGPRVDVMLGAACLILAIACLVLAATIAFSSRALMAKLSSLSGSSGATPAQPAYPVNDAQIRQTLQRELHEVSCCESLRNGKVEVSVNQGEVTLSGEVPSTADHFVATSLARAVTGVTQVQDNIAVSNVSSHTDESASVARNKGEIQASIDLGNKELNSTDNPNYDSAIQHFKQALALDPQNIAARKGLARAQSAKHEEDKILQRHDTDKIAVVRPTPAHKEKLSEDEREAQTWVDLGNKELSSTDTPNYDSAIQYFKLALAVDSKNAAARKGLDRALKAKKAEADILGGHT